MSFSDNPASPTYPSTRFPNPPDCGLVPLTPEMGPGLWTNRETNVLAADLSSEATSATFVNSIEGIPSTGYFSIDDERIFYTSKDNDTKTVFGLERGVDNDDSVNPMGAPSEHFAGCAAYWNYMANQHNFMVKEVAAFEQWAAAFCEDVQNHLTTLDSAVDSLNAQVSDHETRIVDLEACCDANAAAISVLASNPYNWKFMADGDSPGASTVGSGEYVDFVAGAGIALVKGTGASIGGKNHYTLTITNTGGGGGGSWNGTATSDLTMQCFAILNIGYEMFCVTSGDPPVPSAMKVNLYAKDYGSSQRLYMRTLSSILRMPTEIDSVGVLESGTPKGLVGNLDFVGATVTVAGSTATIQVSGSGGGSGFQNPATTDLNMACKNILGVSVISGCTPSGGKGDLNLYAYWDGASFKSPSINLHADSAANSYILFRQASGAQMGYFDQNFFAITSPTMRIGDLTGTPIDIVHGDSTYGHVVKRLQTVVMDYSTNAFIRAGSDSIGELYVGRGPTTAPFTNNSITTAGKLTHRFNPSSGNVSDPTNGLGVLQWVQRTAGTHAVGSVWRGTDDHLYYQNASGAVQLD